MRSEMCVICRAEFRPESLVNRKCEVCRKAHPGANSREEVVDKNIMKEKENAAHIHNIVDTRIYEILTSLKLIDECSCGEKFAKTGPNRKFCEVCSKSRHLQSKKKKVETGE